MTDRLYELGRAIGEGNFSNYMQADWNETKEDFRNIAHAVHRNATAKNAGSILSKASYPITGNLSLSVREKIEDYLGEDIFNSKHAGGVSCFANSFLFSFGIMCTPYREFAGIGMPLGWLHSLARWGIVGEKNVSASLLGKLVSLPIEAGMGIYDGIKSRRKAE